MLIRKINPLGEILTASEALFIILTLLRLDASVMARDISCEDNSLRTLVYISTSL